MSVNLCHCKPGLLDTHSNGPVGYLQTLPSMKDVLVKQIFELVPKTQSDLNEGLEGLLVYMTSCIFISSILNVSYAFCKYLIYYRS